MKELGLLVFKGPEDVPKFAEAFDFTINKNGYVERAGKTIHCKCCDRAIKKESLGTILPGSSVFYCDNPMCLANYVHEYLE